MRPFWFGRDFGLLLEQIKRIGEDALSCPACSLSKCPHAVEEGAREVQRGEVCETGSSSSGQCWPVALFSAFGATPTALSKTLQPWESPL